MNNECPICFEEMITGIKETECCNQKFHIFCYDKWVLQCNTCPLCRKNDNMVIIIEQLPELPIYITGGAIQIIFACVAFFACVLIIFFTRKM